MDSLKHKSLAILKSALYGEKQNEVEGITSEDWQNLFSMASIHSVLPMFYEAVYASPSLLIIMVRQSRQSGVARATCPD